MGLGLSARAFDELPSHLAKRFRVVTFDNRGTGRSTRPRGLFKVADMADDAARVLAAAGIPRAHVFGISMGGMIATELALRHPSRVERLALGCTFAGWRRSKHPPLSVMHTLLRGVGSKDRAALVKLASVLVSEQFAQTDLERFLAWLQRGEAASPRVTALQIAAVARHTTEARLATLRTPTLVITGDADRLILPENSERLARWIPGAELRMLPGAGHCFPFEQTEATVAALGTFFGADCARAAVPVA